VDRETTTHADHVGTDEELGGRLVAEHLLALGHRKFAHLTWPNWPGSVARRREAFVKAVEKGGGECKIYEGVREQQSNLARELLKPAGRPTAVFAATDLMAMKVYAAAAEYGLKIPDDLSVVGYADFPFAEDLVPALTTVRQDPYQIGCVAAQILLDRILERTDSAEPRKIRLKPEPIIRKSTGPVPAS